MAYETITEWCIGFQREVLSAPELAPLRPGFPVRPEAFADPNLCARLHGNVMKSIFRHLSEPMLALTVGGIDRFVRQRLGVSDRGLCSGTAVDAAAERIDTLGHTPLARVPARKTDEMRAYLDDEPCYAWGLAEETETTSLAKIRESGHPFARYPTKSVLGCPHLVDVATHPEVVAVVARHLGAIPTILEYAAWWSFAGPDAARESQLLHFDFPDYRFCLLFLYLTDVDEDGGPHTFVDATHELRHVAEARSRFSGDGAEFDEWYFSKHRKTDGEVARYVGGQPVSLTGPSGSRFLVNTRGLHKGMRPTGADRLICEVVYGVSPQPQVAFTPVALGTPAMAHVPAWVATPPFDYVNRMFVAPANGA